MDLRVPDEFVYYGNGRPEAYSDMLDIAAEQVDRINMRHLNSRQPRFPFNPTSYAFLFAQPSRLGQFGLKGIRLKYVQPYQVVRSYDAPDANPGTHVGFSRALLRPDRAPPPLDDPARPPFPDGPPPVRPAPAPRPPGPPPPLPLGPPPSRGASGSQTPPVPPGIPPSLRNQRFRLPSGEEWEFANGFEEVHPLPDAPPPLVLRAMGAIVARMDRTLHWVITGRKPDYPFTTFYIMHQDYEYTLTPGAADLVRWVETHADQMLREQGVRVFKYKISKKVWGRLSRDIHPDSDEGDLLINGASAPEC